MAQPFVPGAVPVWVGFRTSPEANFPNLQAAPPRLGGARLTREDVNVFGASLTSVQSLPSAQSTAFQLGARLNSADVAQQGSGGPLFLGFTTHGVDLEIHPEYAPMTTDAGGGPTDAIFRGSQGVMTLDLSRWREDTYALLADNAALNLEIGKRVRGNYPFGRVGTIMGLEKASVTIYLAFPYATKLAYQTMPIGYRFPHCILSREGLPQRGSKPARLLLTFLCYRTPDPKLLAGGAWPATDEPAYLLYDNDVSILLGRLPD